MAILEATPPPDRVVEIIKAIGSTWPFLLTVFFIFVSIYYRKAITTFLTKTKNITLKAAGGEVSLETEPLPTTKLEIIEIKENKQGSVLQTEEKVEEKKEDADHWTIYLALKEKDKKKADTLFSQMQEKEIDEMAKERNKMIYLQSQFLYGNINTRSELETLVEGYNNNNELKCEGYQYLAYTYKSVNDYPNAAKYYLLASNYITKDSEKVTIARSLSEVYFAQDNAVEAYKQLDSALLNISDPKEIKKIYQEISETFKKKDEWLLQSVALEMALLNDPNNTSLLFDVAYAYANSYKNSASQAPVMAVLHYSDLVYQDNKSEAGFNNLGVAYSNLGIKGNAVAHYKKSVELGNTLAAANLASTYLHAGFYTEARDLLENAKTKEKPHENVWLHLTTLAQQEKDEKNKREEIFNQANKIQTFIRTFGEIFFKQNANIQIDTTTQYSYADHDLIFIQHPGTNIFELKWSDNLLNYTLNCVIENIAFSGKGQYSTQYGSSTSFSSLLYFSPDKSILNMLVLTNGPEYKNFILQFAIKKLLEAPLLSV